MLPVQPAVRRIGFWNCEMDEDDFLDYIGSVGILNTDKIELLHLRGQPVRLLTDAGMDWTINWLIDNDGHVVVEIVTGSPGLNTRSLTEAVRERIPSHSQDHASKAIATAKRLGLVHTVNGKNNAKLFHLGPDPAPAAQQQWADMYPRR